MQQQWFTIKQLQPQIWGIGEFGHFQDVISYLIVGKKEALLIDTGMGIGDMYSEVRRLTEKPINVINTHCHFDHIGGNNQFESILLFDNVWGKSVAENGLCYKDVEQHMPPDGFRQQQPGNFTLEHYKIEPFVWNKLVMEADMISVDPFHFRIIHTPGHSPDSICLYEETYGYLFTGDTLYPGPIYLQLPESNWEDYKKSIKTLVELNNIQYIFPSHNDFSVQSSELVSLYKAVNKDVKKQKNTIYVSETISILV